ncbi:hypothetical protein AAC387_Pa01g0414 [Persea americana]
MMIDANEFLCNFSFISLCLRSLKLLRKAIRMAICSSSWMDFRSPVPALGGLSFASVNRPQEVPCNETHPVENLLPESPASVPRVLSPVNGGPPLLNSCSKKNPEENFLFYRTPVKISRVGPQNSVQNNVISMRSGCTEEISVTSKVDGLSSMVTCKGGEVKVLGKVRKRPARIAIPQMNRDLDFEEVGLDGGEKDFHVGGRDFCLASKKGKRKAMEDGYGFITEICGNSKQAFFGVFDGHGGRAAVDYASDKLGRNIITAMAEYEKAENQLEQAIRAGYLTTDKEFLSQGVSSGTCAATVLLKDGELHVSNVGDCRVVLSRKGIADPLTKDHRVQREDERVRIESSGGYVNCHSGVWRVQGSLAVSRAIGDVHLKEWVISEPETNKLRLTPDCEFLIIASDGLWDMVTNQEAVDVVLTHKDSIESCRKLVDISSSRGSRDDITVMVVNLHNFTL